MHPCMYTCVPMRLCVYLPMCVCLYVCERQGKWEKEIEIKNVCMHGYVRLCARETVLYTVPMNINWYVLFLINMADIIVRGLICWLSRRLLGRSCLMWVPRKPSIHVTQPTLFEPHGAVLPHVLTLGGRARFIAWRLRRPFFMRMPTEPEAFLELLGVSGLRPCVRTHLKKLCGAHDEYLNMRIK